MDISSGNRSGIRSTPLDDLDLRQYFLIFLACTVLPIVISAAASIIASVVSEGSFEQNPALLQSNTLFSLYTQLIGALIAIAVCCFILRGRIKELLSSIKNHRAILIGALLGAAVFGISALSEVVFQLRDNENQEVLMKEMMTSPALFFISAVILTPIIEELAFRVAVFTPLKKINKPVSYLIITIIFAFIHIDLGSGDLTNELLSLPSYLIAAFGLAFAYDRFGFWSSVAMHFTNNLLAASVSMITLL